MYLNCSGRPIVSCNLTGPLSPLGAVCVVCVGYDVVYVVCSDVCVGWGAVCLVCGNVCVGCGNVCEWCGDVHALIIQYTLDFYLHSDFALFPISLLPPCNCMHTSSLVLL